MGENHIISDVCLVGGLMQELGDLIGAITSKYGIKLNGYYDLETPIDTISFFTLDLERNFDKNSGTLYLAELRKDDFEGLRSRVKRFMNNPILLLSNGEDLDCEGVVYIKEEIDIFELFNTLQEELKKSSGSKDYEYKLFHSLYRGKGIEELLRIAHSYLNNPISICDTSFGIISSYPIVSDRENLETIKGKQYLKEKAFQDMFDRNIIDQLYETDKPIVTHFDNYNYDWLFKNLRVNNTIIGYICIRSTVRDFSDADYEFLEVFSQMLSIELQKEINYYQPTGLWYEYFLTELLKGVTIRSGYILDYLKFLNGKSSKYFSLVLVRSDNDHRTKHKFKSYFDQMSAILPGSMVILFQGDLLVFLPSDTVDPFENYSKKRLESFLKLNDLKAFISYPFSDIEESSTYYKQVLNLADMRPREALTKRDNFIYFADNVLEQIFNEQSDRSSLKALIHPDIIELINYDRDYETEFVLTLKTYLENRNSNHTAQKLHIHKSTFFYRLKKMEELFGITIKDTKKLFDYEFSFRLLDYLSHENER